MSEFAADAGSGGDYSSWMTEKVLFSGDGFRWNRPDVFERMNGSGYSE